MLRTKDISRKENSRKKHSDPKTEIPLSENFYPKKNLIKKKKYFL